MKKVFLLGATLLFLCGIVFSTSVFGADIELAIASWNDIESASGSLVSLLQPRPFLRGEDT